MFLGDAAGHAGTDRARRNVDRSWRENARQTLGPERHRRQRIVIGQRGQHNIAGGKIGELGGSPSTSQRRCSLRVSVIDRHLMTVLNKIDGKSVSHMTETDHTDSSDDEFGGPEGSLVFAVDAVMSSLAGRKAAMGRSAG
jgi:hypothetical protein